MTSRRSPATGQFEKTWTPEKDSVLQEWYGKVPDTELAEQLETSVDVLQHRAPKLGLRKYRPRRRTLSPQEIRDADRALKAGESLRSIARPLGTSHQVVNRAVKRWRSTYQRERAKARALELAREVPPLTTFRISDRQVVHHILTGVVASDHAGETFSESSWGASLGGYGPGRGSNIQPVDTGVWVPPSGGVGFQNHYTPYGRETTEKTQMGIYFYPKGQEPKYILRTFGIFDFWGLWFVQANVVRDLAALNKMELLPWDVWGLMTLQEEPDAAVSSLTDTVADVASGDDTDAVRSVYEDNESLRVPDKVFDARFEVVHSLA